MRDPGILYIELSGERDVVHVTSWTASGLRLRIIEIDMRESMSSIPLYIARCCPTATIAKGTDRHRV
jgi:hypothetical protein